jgi:hypothetical protein
MKKRAVRLYVDPDIPLVEIIRAISTIGCTLRGCKIPEGGSLIITPVTARRPAPAILADNVVPFVAPEERL